MAATCIYLLVFIALTALLSFLLGTDISSLVIASQNDCDTILNTHGVNDFLFIGSIVHITATILLFILAIFAKRTIEQGWSLQNYGYYSLRKEPLEIKCIAGPLATCVVLMCLCGITYSVIGFVLYSRTNIRHQCSNTSISSIILKFIIYIFVLPTILSYTNILHFDFYEKTILWIQFMFGLCVLFFAADIAGLVVGIKNDCDLAIGESEYVSFGVNTYLLYGCGVHLIVVITEIIILFWLLASAHRGCVDRHEDGVIYGVLCCIIGFVLFCIAW
eukprot:992030_1